MSKKLKAFMRKVINKQCYCFQLIFILFDTQIEEMGSK